MAYNIEKTKGKISEIKKKLEAKKGELANLEQNKRELIEAGAEVGGSNLDERTQSVMMDSIDQSLDANAQRGQELSGEMNTDLQELETMRQEGQESIESNERETAKAERLKGLLDKFGIGGAMDKGLSALNENRQELADVDQELAKAQQEIFDLSTKAGML